MSALPSLRQLRYLVTLSEHRNFTRAAAACFVTQSTLSAGLKELEETLGARLVERDRQSVLVTPLGAEVVARARALLAAAEDLAQIAATAAKPMAGVIRLGVIPTVAPFLLPRIMPALRGRFPLLKLALREDLTANLLSRLASGQIDFALIALPYDTANFLVQPLFDDPFCLVAVADDPILLGKRLTISATLADRLLLLEEGHCLREHTLAACPRKSMINDASIEATSLLTLVQMVESGMGIALLPEMSVRSGLLGKTGLATRALAASAPHRTIALAGRRSTARREEFDQLAGLIVELWAGTSTSSKPQCSAP
jgi:LysR family hydrogen peroxide-inducible transcriptional activator